MKVTSYLSLFAGLLSAASAMDASEIFEQPQSSALEPRARCVKGLHVVAVGGQGATRGNLGYLQSLANSIVARIPNSNYYHVAYPEGASSGGAAVDAAKPLLRKHIKNYFRSCPHTKIATIGYSIGASVVMDVLCGEAATGAHDLKPGYRKRLIANVVYGDLGNNVPEPKWNRGTCNAPGKVPRAKPGKCAPYAGITAGYCDYNDTECCSGSDPNVHFSYPDKYDGAATNFVAHRYRASKKGKGF